MSLPAARYHRHVCSRAIWLGALLFLLLAIGCARPTARPVEQRPFSMVVLPDTQYYSQKWPDPFFAQTNWIKQNREKENIVFVMHVGDLVQNHSRQPSEWKVADEAMAVLDGVVPYGIAIGNHDYDGKEGLHATTYLRHFDPEKRFKGQPGYGGASPNRLNSCHLVSAGGVDFDGAGQTDRIRIGTGRLGLRRRTLRKSGARRRQGRRNKKNARDRRTHDDLPLHALMDLGWILIEYRFDGTARGTQSQSSCGGSAMPWLIKVSCGRGATRSRRGTGRENYRDINMLKAGAADHPACWIKTGRPRLARYAAPSSRSIADIRRASVGSTAAGNAAASWPSRPTRYLWKFQRGVSSGRSIAAQR